MEELRKYHLHKDDYANIHFEIKAAKPYCELNAKHCFKAHQHSFYQLIWFQEAGQHYVDYEILSHPANSLFFLNRGQIHYFCPEAQNEGTLFHFDDFFLRQSDPEKDRWIQYKLFNEIGKPYVVLSDKDAADFSYLTHSLQDELEHRPYNYQRQLYYQFQTLLLKIERLKQSQQGTSEKLDHNFILAMRFKQLVEDHLDAFLSVQTYSEKLGISSKKLTAISAQYLHHTPSKLIHRRKILEAKRLLSNLKLSIKEVGYTLGFDQPTYFTKYFKKHTGITPKAFIKQLPQ